MNINKILAIDTASNSCSAGVFEKDSILSELCVNTDVTHSKNLMSMIDTALKLAGLKIGDMDAIAAVKGPGSFTGLRIGISAAKGLALAAEKPLIGISSLEALAMGASKFAGQLLICSMIDARRGEVYFAGYKYKENLLFPELEKQAVKPEKALLQINEPAVFVGDGVSKYKDLITSKLKEKALFLGGEFDIIRAFYVSQLAMLKNADEFSDIIPDYIRKSDAEMNFGIN